MSFQVTLPRAGGQSFHWQIVDAEQKLRLRDQLPGAHGYDRVGQGLLEASAKGVSLGARLAPALPASWMVNNKATSPVLKAWISPEALPAWELLVGRLSQGPEAWCQASEDDKREVAFGVEALLVPPAGGLCAVSKVLALLAPQSVPLLDDAALHLLTEEVARPKDADHPQAPLATWVPAMDAFCGAVVQVRPELEALSGAVDGLELMPAQVLDRLLWMDSWGYQHFKGRKVSGPDNVRIELG